MKYLLFILLIISCMALNPSAMGAGPNFDDLRNHGSIVAVSGYSEQIWQSQPELPDLPDEIQTGDVDTSPESGIPAENPAQQSSQTPPADPAWSGSEWLQALESEGVLDLKPLTFSNFVNPDYKKILRQTSMMSRSKLQSAQSDLFVTSGGRPDLGAGKTAVQSAGKSVSEGLDFLTGKLEGSVLYADQLREKSHFLDRIQLKAEIVVL